MLLELLNAEPKSRRRNRELRRGDYGNAQILKHNVMQMQPR
jgi:hypothetical protein